jgi:hypothetical protein
MAEMQRPEEMAPETSYQKGLALERMFSDYLVNELGYKSTRIRPQVRSNNNFRGINVDIIAERKNEHARWYKVAAYCFLFAGFYILMHAFLAPSFLQLLSVLLLFFMVYACFNSYEERKMNHAWVECKHHNKPVSHAMVQKAVIEYESHNLMEPKDYNFTAMYFVASEGFIDNALKFAVDKKVNCYIIKNGIFEKIIYL